MSVSFNGVVFKTTNIFQLSKELGRWRDTVQLLGRAKLAALYAKGITKLIDDAVAKDEPIPTNPLHKVDVEIRDFQREIVRLQRRNPPYDFEFTVMIFPYEGKLYGLIFTEQSDWEQKFRAQVPLDDFSYWDGTDPDEDVPEAEWKQRESVWDQYDNGLKFKVDCSVNRFLDVSEPSKHEIVKAIAPKQDRALRIARDRAYVRFSEMDEEFLAEKAEADSRFEDPPLSIFVGLVRRFGEWTETKAGKCVITLEAGHVISTLPDITMDMI